MEMKYSIVIAVCLLTIPCSINAADFDGSQPLLCAFMKAMECTPEEGCKEATVESLNVRQFVKVDFKKTEITAPDGKGRTTPIENIKQIGNKLIIQGADAGIQEVRDGVGWTAAIMQDTGKVILTASGEDAGFVLFGACIPLPQ